MGLRKFIMPEGAHRAGSWQHPLVVSTPHSGDPSSRESGQLLAAPEDRPHFSLFGIPVRVKAEFWIIGLLFGLGVRHPTFGPGFRAALLWTAVVFVSIMIHELGHALVARAFGWKPSIMLYRMGGLTSYRPSVQSRPRDVAVSLAGPLAGFAFGGLVFLAQRKLHLSESQLWLVRQLLWVNFFWGAINLLPVLPLDGGLVLRAVLGPRRLFVTWAISATVGGLAVLAGLRLGSLWMAILFGLFTMQAFSQARVASAVAADLREGLEDRLAEAKAALQRGALDDAWLLADDIIRRAKSQPLRNGAYTALAWVHLERGQGARARAALAEIDPPHAVDPYTVAAVEDAAGDPERARAILEEARRQGYRTVESSKLLIDLHARDGRIESAVDVAVEDADLLGRDDVRAVFTAAVESGAHRSAARLAARTFELHGEADDALAEARALALSGDVAGALAALAHAVAVGPVDRAAILADPAFSTLAADERFVKMLG